MPLAAGASGAGCGAPLEKLPSTKVLAALNGCRSRISCDGVFPASAMGCHGVGVALCGVATAGTHSGFLELFFELFLELFFELFRALSSAHARGVS